MNQGGYFGAYRGGFQTLPANAYQMMTAPTQQLASTITNLAGTAAGAYKGFQAEKAGTEAFKQGAATQYKGLESTSQATGVPINPELANQYMNMGEMSTPQQQAAFQQSLNQELQRQQMLYGIANQQRQSQQAQGGLYRQGLSQAISGFSEPFYEPTLPNSGATTEPMIDASLLPQVPNHRHDSYAICPQ
jgi:hypothetical protein